MYHYDPRLALEELRDDAVLPHPVHLRDMILRTKLDASLALDLNREFQDYLARFGDLQKIAQDILEQVASGTLKASAFSQCWLAERDSVPASGGMDSLSSR